MFLMQWDQDAVFYRKSLEVLGFSHEQEQDIDRRKTSAACVILDGREMALMNSLLDFLRLCTVAQTLR